MKLFSLSCFLISLSNLLFSQSIILKPQQEGKDPVILNKGYYIFVIVRDTLHLDSNQFRIKNNKYDAYLDGIENELLTLRSGKKTFLTIKTDQIIKIKRQFPVLQPLGFLPLAAGVLVYLNSVDQLYLGPASIYLLGASILYRLTFDLLINPRKRIAPDLWKNRNRWNLDVVHDH